MNNNLKKTIYSAIMLALALVLPLLTANSTELGNAFCLMHIPVLLCGFVCGPLWGGALGITAPLLRTLIFSMPPFPSVAVPMAFELCAYAVTAGVLYRVFPKRLPFLYAALSISLIVGRVALAVAKYFVLGLSGNAFVLSTFITGSVFPAWPGILLQLAVVPPTVAALIKAGIIRNK